MHQVKALAKMQLGLWGIDYFDLFLVHFPISLKYVDPNHRYPPEWFGDDSKVHFRAYHWKINLPWTHTMSFGWLENTPMRETWGAMEELVDEGLAKNIGLRFVSYCLQKVPITPLALLTRV